jgi:hypothetical protein
MKAPCVVVVVFLCLSVCRVVGQTEQGPVCTTPNDCAATPATPLCRAVAFGASVRLMEVDVQSCPSVCTARAYGRVGVVCVCVTCVLGCLLLVFLVCVCAVCVCVCMCVCDLCCEQSQSSSTRVPSSVALTHCHLFLLCLSYIHSQYRHVFILT